MKLLFERLAKICAADSLREKILLMPSLSAGHALVQSFNLAGYGSINLHINTVTGIALAQVSPRLHREGLRPISHVLAARMIQEIMQELLQNDALAYFHTLQAGPAMAGAIWAALQELEEVGYHPDLIPGDKFISSAKAADIKLIFTAYKKRLSDKGFVDRAGLLHLALQAYTASSFSGALFLLPSNLETTPLEQELLAKIIKDNAWASLPLEEVRGLKTPAHYFFAHAPADRPAEDQGSILGSIYSASPAVFQPDELPQIDFFHAYGETAEVREVMRQIKRENIKLEDAVAYYTSREPYAQLFYEEALRCGIALTFGEGIDVGNFRPGALFFSLTEWIKTDFSVKVLYRLIESSAFKTDLSTEPHQSSMARELRSSGIVRGRERYLKWLDAQLLHPPPGKEIQAGFAGLLSGLLASVPIPDRDSLICPGELAAGLADILKQRSVVAGGLEAGAYSTILDNLNLISQSPAERTTMAEAVKWVEGIIASLQVARSLPQAGSLHIDGYRNGLWTARDRVFVVGLDGRKFPGQTTEDPILLDLEREELSGRLRKYRFQPAENLYKMVQLLAARGSGSSRITLSFPSFDTVENREESPSPLILQAYRLATGETGTDYSSLLQKLGPRRGFTPQGQSDPLDEAEWWLKNLMPQRATTGAQAQVLQYYPHLQKGLYARRQRSSPFFTAYDGAVSSPEPLWEDGKLLSASALEQFGKCPYGYFLKYVLKIYPPDEAAADPGKWLDALTRGSLLHSIYEDFYRKLLERGEVPSYRGHLGLLESIARTKIEEIKEEQPPPHQVIYEYESKELLESCRLFLRAETEKAADSSPVWLELTFGLKGDLNTLTAAEIPPVRIKLPSGRSLQLRGKIDRVDCFSGDGSYAVLDYKTGSTYGFSPGSKFRGGRQLQHALYGLALEEILKSMSLCADPQIRECGYIFPTLKGEGQRVMRPYPECRAEALEIVDSMCEMLDSGTFVMTTDPDEDCNYCDYRAVCDTDTFGAAIKTKVESSGSGPLAKFLAIRQLK